MSAGAQASAGEQELALSRGSFTMHGKSMGGHPRLYFELGFVSSTPDKDNRVEGLTYLVKLL
jgi:hypothetical protein